MTWEQTIRAALVARRNELGWSNNDLEVQLADRFGEHAPSGSTVDRAMRGVSKMTVQQVEMFAAVMDANVVDVLAGVTPGQAAQYRCILPSQSVQVNAQVRGGSASPQRRASDLAHVA